MNKTMFNTKKVVLTIFTVMSLFVASLTVAYINNATITSTSTTQVVTVRSGEAIVFSIARKIESINFSTDSGFTIRTLEGGVWSDMSNNPSDYSPMKGYIIRNNNAENLVINIVFKSIVDINDTIFQKTLKAGWNLMGPAYINDDGRIVEILDALGNSNYSHVADFSGHGFIKEKVVNTISGEATILVRETYSGEVEIESKANLNNVIRNEHFQIKNSTELANMKLLEGLAYGVFVSNDTTIPGSQNLSDEEVCDEVSQLLGLCDGFTNVQNLKATTIDNNTINIEWDEENDAQKYIYYYGTSSQTYTSTGETINNSISLTLNEQTKYYFAVSYINNVGEESSKSGEKFATTGWIVSPGPTNVNGIETSSGTIQLTWDEFQYAENYNVRYADFDFDIIDVLVNGNVTTLSGITTNSETISGLGEGKNYYFQVMALNQYGDTSSLSEKLMITTSGCDEVSQLLGLCDNTPKPEVEACDEVSELLGLCTNFTENEVDCSSNQNFGDNSCNVCYTKTGNSFSHGSLSWNNNNDLTQAYYKEEQTLPNMINLLPSEVTWSNDEWDYHTNIDILYSENEGGYVLHTGSTVSIYSHTGTYSLTTNTTSTGGLDVGLLKSDIIYHNILNDGSIEVNSNTNTSCVLIKNVYDPIIDAPNNFKITSASGGNVSLSWDAVEGGLMYYVYYGTGSINISEYSDYTDFIEGTSITINGLDEGQDYYFAITSLDENGEESTYSEERYISSTCDEVSELLGFCTQWDVITGEITLTADANNADNQDIKTILAGEEAMVYSADVIAANENVSVGTVRFTLDEELKNVVASAKLYLDNNIVATASNSDVLNGVGTSTITFDNITTLDISTISTQELKLAITTESIGFEKNGETVLDVLITQLDIEDAQGVDSSEIVTVNSLTSTASNTFNVVPVTITASVINLLSTGQAEIQFIANAGNNSQPTSTAAPVVTVEKLVFNNIGTEDLYTIYESSDSASALTAAGINTNAALAPINGITFSGNINITIIPQGTVDMTYALQLLKDGFEYTVDGGSILKMNLSNDLDLGSKTY